MVEGIVKNGTSLDILEDVVRRSFVWLRREQTVGETVTSIEDTVRLLGGWVRWKFYGLVKTEYFAKNALMFNDEKTVWFS